MEKNDKSIGIKVEMPKKECKDHNCPFHGSLKVRGRIFTGTVIGDKMQKTVTVEWGRQHFLPKYERYERRRTRIKAHNPECMNAKKGDIVKISECRSLSKTKNFVIIEVLGEEKGFKERIEALEEGKTRKKEKIEDKKIAEEAENAAAQSESN